MSSAKFEELAELAARHDSLDMAGVIRGMSAQVRHAAASELPALPKGPFERVVVTGIGGSALSAEVVIHTLGARASAPIEICREYRHRGAADERTLVIASSFSGNTEETLEATADLVASGARVVALTAGGQLAASALESGWPLVSVPRESAGFQPRCATGYGVTLIARILTGAGVLPDASAELAALADFLDSLDVFDQALQVARWLDDRIPVIYADERNERSAARIMKIKLNENAKRPAFFGAIPEINHNEMLGFTTAIGRFAVLYLRDPESHPWVHQRYETMRDLFAERGFGHVSFAEWTIPGASSLQKSFAAITFGDWVTWCRALLDGIDPTPVEIIESYKKALVGRRSG